MAPADPKTSESGDSATKSGAEFEENKADNKIEVKVRARAVKPESTGDSAPEEIANKPSSDDKKPALVAPPKASTLKPDISAEEAKPDEVDSPDEPKPDDGAVIDELAKEAADKKVDKPTDGDSKVQNLIDNKTYFVPIGQVTKRRNTKIFVVIILLVVAACLGAYFMMMG